VRKTKIYKPSDNNIIIKIKIIIIHYTSTFNIDKIKHASNAVPNPSKRNESNNWATAMSAIALRIIDKNQRININVPPLHSVRSEEHTSELQSRFDLVCRLLLEKKKQHKTSHQT